MNPLNYFDQSGRVMRELETKIHEDFSKQVDTQIKESRKLNIYVNITTNECKVQNYLLFVKSGEHRRMLARLRISAHRLEVERGRWTTHPPPTHPSSPHAHTLTTHTHTHTRIHKHNFPILNPSLHVLCSHSIPCSRRARCSSLYAYGYLCLLF